MKNIHTLQELNLDAARYRWLRENLQYFAKKHLSDGHEMCCAVLPCECDSLIDEELDND